MIVNLVWLASHTKPSSLNKKDVNKDLKHESKDNKISYRR